MERRDAQGSLSALHRFSVMERAHFRVQGMAETHETAQLFPSKAFTRPRRRVWCSGGSVAVLIRGRGQGAFHTAQARAPQR
jgi:hypothetical protein